MANDIGRHIPADMNRINSENRSSTITTKKGDKVGSNFLVPGGDFTHLMGNGKGQQPKNPDASNLPGGQVLDHVLSKQLKELGERTAKNGSQYRNAFVSNFKINNQPGAEKDALKEIGNAVHRGYEDNQDGLGALVNKPGLGTSGAMSYMDKMNDHMRQDNYKYLEAQYRAEWLSKSTSLISTMMKARHDAIKQSISKQG